MSAPSSGIHRCPMARAPLSDPQVRIRPGRRCPRAGSHPRQPAGRGIARGATLLRASAEPVLAPCRKGSRTRPCGARLRRSAGGAAGRRHCAVGYRRLGAACRKSRCGDSRCRACPARPARGELAGLARGGVQRPQGECNRAAATVVGPPDPDRPAIILPRLRRHAPGRQRAALGTASRFPRLTPCAPLRSAAWIRA